MNVNLGLASQTKCDDMFSDPELDHIFSHFLVTYLVYFLFILICGNYPLTLKRGRCRNLLSIDYRLNQIDPSTNIISLTNADHLNITLQNTLSTILYIIPSERVILTIIILDVSATQKQLCKNHSTTITHPLLLLEGIIFSCKM